MDMSDLPTLLPSVALVLAAALLVRERHGRSRECRRRAEAESALEAARSELLASRSATREAIERLRLSESFNRGVIDASPDCIKVLSARGELEFFSAGGLRAMEIDDFEICGLRGTEWCSLWSQADRGKVQAAIDAALAGGLGRFQAPCATLKGTPKWWDVTVTRLPGIGGEPDRLLSISRDITEQKQAELALAEARADAERLAAELGRRVRELGGALDCGR